MHSLYVPANSEFRRFFEEDYVMFQNHVSSASLATDYFGNGRLYFNLKRRENRIDDISPTHPRLVKTVKLENRDSKFSLDAHFLEISFLIRSD